MAWLVPAEDAQGPMCLSTSWMPIPMAGDYLDGDVFTCGSEGPILAWSVCPNFDWIGKQMKAIDQLQLESKYPSIMRKLPATNFTTI